MQDVAVITDATAAMAALDPVRCRLLGELREPASAATLADRLDLSRQRINYHLRQLEAHGLVEVAETRRWGGITERVMVATAAGYVVSPDVIGDPVGDPGRTRDRLSAAYVIALAARVVREVGGMAAHAARAGKRLPLYGLDVDIRFRSPADRAAFAEKLAAAVTRLAAEYHDDTAPDGRWQRVVATVHPVPKGAEPTTPREPGTARSEETADDHA